MILDLRESLDDGHPLPGDPKTLAAQVAAKGSRQSGPGNPWIRRRRTHGLGVNACTQAVAADPEELVAVVRHPITEIDRDLILTALEFFIVEFDDASAVLTDEMVVVGPGSMARTRRNNSSTLTWPDAPANSCTMRSR